MSSTENAILFFKNLSSDKNLIPNKEFKGLRLKGRATYEMICDCCDGDDGDDCCAFN